MATPAKQRALREIIARSVGPAPAMLSRFADRTLDVPDMPQHAVDATPIMRDDPPAVPDEETLLRQRAAIDNLAADSQQSSARFIETVTGAPGSGVHENMRERANEPLKSFLRLQERQPKPGKLGAVPKSTDPMSVESKRAQALVRSTLPDWFSDEEIANMSEADADAALKYGTLAAQRQVTREGQVDTNKRSEMDRTQRAELFAKRYNLDWAKLSQDQQQFLSTLADREKDRDIKKETNERALNERNVGGFAFDPANPPSPDAAKKMADVSIQATTITGGLDALENLYRSSGTEITGETSGTMAAEWKNLTDMLRTISNMGVPNGRDYEMLAMQLENPTEMRSFLTSKARGLAQMQAVRNQIQRLVSATANAYKYTPQAAKRVTSRSVLPTDAGGAPTLDPIPPAPKLAPGQKLVDALQEGKPVRVHMGGGQSRVVVKRNGRLKILEGQ